MASVNNYNLSNYSGFEIYDPSDSNLTENKAVDNKGSESKIENGFDDFDVIDKADIENAQPASLKGAEVGKPDRKNTLAEGLRKYVPERMGAFKNFLLSIPRGFMNLCHTIRSAFCPALKSSLGADDKSFRATDGAYELPYTSKYLPPFKASNEELGGILGLRGKITIKSFPEPKGGVQGTNAQKRAARLFTSNGELKLSDIKQDPSRQDCWFLSSITALMRAQGAHAIMRLFDLEQPGGDAEHVVIRLGKDRYCVPMGEVRGDNGTAPSVSNSAPWVKALETAMAMHIANHGDKNLLIDNGFRTGGVKINMDYNTSALGINTLLGYDPSTLTLNGSDVKTVAAMTGNGSTVDATFAALKGGITAGQPIVLGSPDGDLKTAMRTGISPGHAVALMDVNMEARVATVLDPYGHITNVSFDDLKEFTVLTAQDPSRDKLERAGQLEPLDHGGLSASGEITEDSMDARYSGNLQRMDAKEWGYEHTLYEEARNNGKTTESFDEWSATMSKDSGESI